MGDYDSIVMFYLFLEWVDLGWGRRKYYCLDELLISDGVKNFLKKKKREKKENTILIVHSSTSFCWEIGCCTCFGSVIN